ncbi:hypothetical protein DFA_10723 [Cavenderia fasciculata]|uniref:Uncharacterized protein n=1 Tax=Cavenderia fasciculata TaxID=261658 RepID=F4QB78_CACFS|nr:uncharacterized protein DFA_10723 [Cavenderia fasciculata]EGG14850.1 hypothetical protein DFA_10723 [Cavenderia fasciculata]|eukprot:XP_004351366.1 hypothetical protein DFA_10723 [Cavenderia fasciculata]
MDVIDDKNKRMKKIPPYQQQQQIQQQYEQETDETKQHYSFLTDQEDVKIIRLICNYLSLGQFELARALIHQVKDQQQLQQQIQQPLISSSSSLSSSLLINNNSSSSSSAATNNSSSSSSTISTGTPTIVDEISSILLHTIKNGPPGSWLTSESIPSASHLQWLCSIELFNLKKDGFKQNVCQHSLLLIEFALMIYTILGEQVNNDRSIAPIIQELREYHYILLYQQQQSQQQQQQHNGNQQNGQQQNGQFGQSPQLTSMELYQQFNNINNFNYSFNNINYNNSYGNVYSNGGGGGNPTMSSPQLHQQNNHVNMILSSRLSGSCQALIKRILIHSPEMASYLVRHLSDPFVTKLQNNNNNKGGDADDEEDNFNQSLLTSKHPVANQLEIVVCEVVNQLLTSGHYNEAYQVLKVIDIKDRSGEEDDSEKMLQLEENSDSDIITRCLQRVANLGVDINYNPQQQQQQQDSSSTSSYDKYRSTCHKMPFKSKLDQKVADYSKTLEMSRLKVYESLLSNRTLYPLRVLLEFEEEILKEKTDDSSTTTTVNLSSSSSSATNTSVTFEFPQCFNILKQYQYYKHQLSDSATANKIMDDFWYWYYHFIRVNNKHFLEYAMQVAIELVKEKRFQEVMIIIQPFPKLLPLIIVLGWDYFREDIASRKKLLDLFNQYPKQEHEEFDEFLVHANKRLAYLVEMAEWCCNNMMTVPNSPGGSSLVIGDNPPIKIRDGENQVLQDHQSKITNQVVNQFTSHSLVHVIKDFLPFINSKDILDLVEKDPDFPINYKQKDQKVSSIGLSKLNDMNLIRGFYLLKNILKFFHYNVNQSEDENNELLETNGHSNDRSSDFRQEEFDQVLEDMEQLIQGVSDPLVSIGLIESIYLSIFISNQNLKQQHQQNQQPLQQQQFDELNLNGEEEIQASSNLPTFNEILDNYKEMDRSSIVDILNQFDTSLKQNEEIKSTENKAFYITPSMLGSLINSLLRVIEYIKNTNDLQKGQERIEILSINLENLKYRSEIVNWLKLKIPNKIPFMNLIVMPIQSLLILCMRTNYPNFKETINYFKVTKEIEKEVNQYQSIPLLFNYLNSSINSSGGSNESSSSSSLEDLKKIVPLITDSDDVFIILCDIILGSSDKLEKEYVDKSIYQLISDNNSIEYTTYCTSSSSSSLEQIIKKKQEMVTRLNRLIESTIDPIKKQLVESNDIQAIIDLDQDSLLSKSFKYMISINNIVNNLPVDQSISSEDTVKYLDIIKVGPKKLLEQIIFNEQNYQKAEQLSEYLQVDLLDFIISSLHFINPNNNSNNNNNQSSSLSPSSTNNSISSTSTITSTTVISKSLLEYLSSSSVILAILLCMLKSHQSQGSKNEFIKLAKESAKGLPSSTLSNWIEEMTRAVSLVESDPLLEPLLASTDLVTNTETLQQQQPFYYKIIQQLISCNQLEKALKIADEFLEDGAPDWLLNLLVQRSNDKLSNYRYIRRIRDKKQARQLIKDLYHFWDVSTCIDMVVYSKYYLERELIEKENLIEESSTFNNLESVERKELKDIERLYQCLLIYQSILVEERKSSSVSRPAKWTTWQEIDQLCRRDPATMVRQLLDSRHYELARKIRDLFSVTNVRNEIEERYLFYLLVEKDDASLALQTLATLGSEAAGIIGTLLPKLRQVSVKLFLVQFLLSNNNALDSDRRQELEQQEMGYKILLLLPMDLQKEYEPFVNWPNLILEMLIMNEKIPLVAKLLHEIKDLKNDDLFCYYSRKALSFARYMAKNEIYMFDDYNTPNQPKPNSIPSAPTSPVSPGGTSSNGTNTTTTKKLKWVLNGQDTVQDEKTRHEHFFVRSPSISLAKSLFDLCESKKKVYQTSLELYNYLSSRLQTTATYSDDNLLIINMIQQLLLYTKLQLLRDINSGGPTLVAVLDTYLGKVELYQSLVISKCNGNMSLTDLSDSQKARQLRDKLISEDRLKLAIDVATKCNIPADPAWVSWGMSLLQLGNYSDAREKFKYCLTSGDGNRRIMSPSTSLLSQESVDSSLILNQIIQLLETPPLPNHNNIRNLYNFFNQKGVTNVKIDDNQFYSLLTQQQQQATSSSPPTTSSSSLSSSQGLSATVSPRSNANTNGIASERLEEIIYYIKKYGTDCAAQYQQLDHGRSICYCQAARPQAYTLPGASAQRVQDHERAQMVFAVV